MMMKGSPIHAALTKVLAELLRPVTPRGEPQ